MTDVLTNYKGLASLLSTRVVLQMTDDIYLDRPDVAPLIAFLTKLKKTRTTKNMEFHYLEKTTRPTHVPITSSYTANGLTFAVSAANSKWFYPGQKIWGGNKDGSTDAFGVQYKVTSISTAGALVVTLFPSTQTDVSLAEGDNLILGGQVFGDLEDAPKGRFNDAVDNYNYCQQIMAGITIGEIMTKTQLYGTDVRALEHKEKLMEFKASMEADFILSKRDKNVTNQDDPDIGIIYSTGGIDEAITEAENILDFGGAFDYDTLVSRLPEFLEYRTNGSDYAFYTNADLISQIEYLMREKLVIDPNYTAWGQTVTKLKTTWGEFPLVPSRLLDRFGFCLSYFLDMNELQKVDFAGEDGPEPRLYLNAQLTSQPNKLWDFFRAISGLSRGMHKRHSKIYGWTAGVGAGA